MDPPRPNYQVSPHSSGHIIGVISKNVTGTQANAFLQALLVKGTERVGNYIQVSDPSKLYLMHLPKDVLASIPGAGIVNGPMGAHPHDALSAWIGTIANTIVGAATFLWNGLVAFANFMMQVGAAVVEIGLKVIGTLLAAQAYVVNAVIDAAVDAFNAFVAWAIEFIQNVIDAMLSPVMAGVDKLITPYYSSFKSTTTNAHTEMYGSGSNHTISNTTLNQLQTNVYGDFFWVLVSISVVAWLALLALKVITTGFGFVVSIAVMMIIGEIVKNAVQYIAPMLGLDSSSIGKSAVMDQLANLLGQSNKSVTEKNQGLEIFGACWGIFNLFFADLAVFIILKEKLTLALSISMAILGLINLVIGDTLISILTLGVSLLCLMELKNTKRSFAESEEIYKIALASGFIGVGLSMITLGINEVE